jgi:hypothetical protein
MALLLVVFVALYRNRMTRQQFYVNLAIQTTIVLLMKIILGILFAANPGPVIEFHLHANIHSLLLGYSFQSLVWFILILWAIFHDFASKAEVLRKSAIVVPLFLFLIMILGIVFELRAAYEIIPIVAFLGFHTLFFSVLKYPFLYSPLFGVGGHGI